MTIPNASTLTEQIATRASVSPETVETTLLANGVSLVPVAPAQRSLRIHRLSFSGTRTNTKWDGPFRREFEFNSGVTALITNENLRGKSTILELITWALRGSPRTLRADVRNWFDVINLEYEVNGVPMAVTLRRSDDEFLADILRATNQSELTRFIDSGTSSPSVSSIASGLSEGNFREQQDSLMMRLLQLDPITNFQKFPNSDQGMARTNTWPAYFGGIYLPRAGSDILFGDVVFAGLPARILQLFCNVPLMGNQIRLSTLEKVARQDATNQNRRLAEDARARAQERAKLVAELHELEAEISMLPSGRNRSYELVAADLQAAEDHLAACKALHRATEAAYFDAKIARQAEERRISSERETAIASMLFRGLTPKHCPRCEQGFDAARVGQEINTHSCSVCMQPFDIDSSGVLGEASDEGSAEEQEDMLEVLRAAEGDAATEKTSAALAIDTAAAQVERFSEELKLVSQADEFKRRISLQLQAAHLKGKVEGIPVEATTAPASETLMVVEAANTLLKELTAEVGGAMFKDLNREILLLGQKFGIENLQDVQLQRNGGLLVTTAGAQVPFKRVSGGERLRLRVAVVVALLRIGAQTGVGSHPGLILLDSPGSDELTIQNEAVLLEELDSLKSELPDLQVVIASAEPAAVLGHVPDANIYKNLEGGPLW